MTDDKPDIVNQLARLAALHESGALSDAEFGAAKAKVLAAPPQPPVWPPVPSPAQFDETASERRHRLRYLSLAVPLVLVVVVVVVVILGGSATGHKPTAGSPLSVPAGSRVIVVEQPLGTISSQALQQAVMVVSRRLSGLGVRGFAVHTQGDDVVVEFPKGRTDAQVLDVVGQTGQLLFRPVDCIIAPFIGPGTTTMAPTSGSCNLSSTDQEHYMPPHGDSHGVTLAPFDTANATVVLPDYAGYAYGRYVLGPAEMTGSVIKTAVANIDPLTDQWEVDVTLTAAGSTLFNKYAAAHYQCYVEDESNPPYCALQAIELDATVESDPAIEAASFNGGVIIDGSTSDPFTAQQASDMAVVLNSGPLPVAFVAVDFSTVTP